MIASKSLRLEFYRLVSLNVSVRCEFDRLYQENWLEQWTKKKGLASLESLSREYCIIIHVHTNYTIQSHVSGDCTNDSGKSMENTSEITFKRYR